MTRTTAALVLWTPRVVGILFAVFLGLFALDAFGPAKSRLDGLTDFGMHLLPSLAVAAVVLLSWEHEWIGSITCLALALGYIAMVPERPDWILVIAGPLVLLSVAFFCSWRRHAEVRATLR